jgi:predicted membrane protein
MRSVKSMITSVGAKRLPQWGRVIRTASLTAALAASLMLMLFPFLLRHIPAARLHSALPVMLLGVAGAFVHGIGYTPDNKLLRILFGPGCAWALMIGGALLMLAP